jgi:hypothetical protein
LFDTTSNFFDDLLSRRNTERGILQLQYRLAIFLAGTTTIKRINQNVGINQVHIIGDLFMQEMAVIQQLATPTNVLSITDKTYPSFTVRAGHFHNTILYVTRLLFTNPFKTIVLLEYLVQKQDCFQQNNHTVFL